MISYLTAGTSQLHGEGAITLNAAEVLLRRGLKKVTEVGHDNSEDGYIFTRDLRHRVSSLYGYPHEFHREFASRIHCPHLIIKAESGPTYEPAELGQEVVNIMRQNNPNFVFATVPGSHHVHLNEPEKLWPIIQNFLNNANMTS